MVIAVDTAMLEVEKELTKHTACTYNVEGRVGWWT